MKFLFVISLFFSFSTFASTAGLEMSAIIAHVTIKDSRLYLEPTKAIKQTFAEKRCEQDLVSLILKFLGGKGIAKYEDVPGKKIIGIFAVTASDPEKLSNSQDSLSIMGKPDGILTFASHVDAENNCTLPTFDQLDAALNQ